MGFSRGFCILLKYDKSTIKPFDSVKFKRCILPSYFPTVLRHIQHKVFLSEVLLALKFHKHKGKCKQVAIIYDVLKVITLVDWYIWFWWYSGTLGSRNLFIILVAKLCNCYDCFKYATFGKFLCVSNVAVFYSPNIVELGEDFTENLNWRILIDQSWFYLIYHYSVGCCDTFIRYAVGCIVVV